MAVVTLDNAAGFLCQQRPFALYEDRNWFFNPPRNKHGELVDRHLGPTGHNYGGKKEIATSLPLPPKRYERPLLEQLFGYVDWPIGPNTAYRHESDSTDYCMYVFQLPGKWQGDLEDLISEIYTLPGVEDNDTKWGKDPAVKILTGFKRTTTIRVRVWTAYQK